MTIKDWKKIIDRKGLVIWKKNNMFIDVEETFIGVWEFNSEDKSKKFHRPYAKYKAFKYAKEYMKKN